MKRFFSLLIVVIMLFTLPAQAFAAETSTHSDPSIWAEGNVMARDSDYRIMATYYDSDFNYVSESKRITLDDYCIKITYRCTTENNYYDSMVLFIEDLNGNGYDKRLDIVGDGNSHSMDLYLPAGNYEVYVSGQIYIHHLDFAVNFKTFA